MDLSFGATHLVGRTLGQSGHSRRIAKSLERPLCRASRDECFRRRRRGGQRYALAIQHLKSKPQLVHEIGVTPTPAKLRALEVPRAPAQEQRAAEAAIVEREAEYAQTRPGRIGWASVLERMFDIDMRHRPNCGARDLKIIAAVLERPAIEKILTRLGLDPQPPPRGRAREPVQCHAGRAA